MLQVPKMLGTLRTSWAPEAFVVSFKLETDTAILVQKVMLGMYGSGNVISGASAYRIGFAVEAALCRHACLIHGEPCGRRLLHTLIYMVCFTLTVTSEAAA